MAALQDSTGNIIIRFVFKNMLENLISLEFFILDSKFIIWKNLAIVLLLENLGVLRAI